MSRKNSKNCVPKSILVQELNELCKYLDTTYDINNGGCCYVAYEIAKQLDKLSIKYSLAFVSNGFKDVNEIEKELTHYTMHRWDPDSITGYNCCSHYFIKVGNSNVNRCKNCFGGDVYRVKNINASHIQWVYQNGSWNDCYNHSLNKVISSFINSWFKAFKIQHNL